MITTNSTGSLIESYAFAYDINNLITTQTNVVGGITNVWSYSYDLAQELTGAIQKTNGITAHRYSYTYDLAGNRLSEQVDNALAGETPNQLNQLTGKNGAGTVRVSGYLTKPGTASINGTPAAMLTQTNFTSMLYAGVGTNTYSVTASDFNGHSATNSYSFVATQNGLNTTLAYDLAGNLIKKSSLAQTLTFAWDGLDRCVGLTNGVYRTIIAYDGMNRWTRITEYSSTNQTADRRFVWNGTTLAEERDSTGSNVVKRFFGNGFTQTGTNYYYVKDQLGSIVEVTDGSGNIVARFSYDPYGKRTRTFGNLQVDFGFAGLFEHQSGLQFAVFRFKDGARWINRDPIREQGGWNLYAYCQGNPVGEMDINGLDRRKYGMFAHEWIEVDIYNPQGVVVGSMALNFSSKGYDVTTHWSVLTSGLGIPFLNWQITSVKSSRVEDEALLRFWERQQARKDHGAEDYNYYFNNCIETSSSLFYYGTKYHPPKLTNPSLPK